MTSSQRQWLHSSVVRASHRYREVTGSNPVEVLTFSGLTVRNCFNCVQNCDDHGLLDFKSAVQLYETFHISLNNSYSLANFPELVEKFELALHRHYNTGGRSLYQPDELKSFCQTHSPHLYDILLSSITGDGRPTQKNHTITTTESGCTPSHTSLL